eukprot:RCo048022
MAYDNSTFPEDGREEYLKRTFWALITGGLAAAAAITLSLRLIDKHIRWNPHAETRAYVVRVLFMVPVFAAAAWLAVAQRTYCQYWLLFRTFYEAIAVHSFFMFLVAYLGGTSQAAQRVHDRVRLGTGAPIRRIFPAWLCWKDPLPPAAFVQQARFAVRQFVFVMVVLSVVELILFELGLYTEGHWSASDGYPYCAVVKLFSVVFAMKHLIWFYLCLKEELAGCRPLPKLLCIKGVVFLTFIQGWVVAFFVKVKVIRPRGNFTEADVSLAWQNYLLCLEMLVFSILHCFYFPHDEYKRSPGPGAEGIVAGTPVGSATPQAHGEDFAFRQSS